MIVRFVAPLIAATLSLTVVLTACEAEDDGLLVGGSGTTRNRKTTEATPTPPPDKQNPIDGGVDKDNPPVKDPDAQDPGTQNPGKQEPDPDAPRAAFELNVDAVTLTAPPNSGQPLFPTSEKVEARLDGKKVTPLWSSSNAGVATVDATGRIAAVGAGSTVVTAAYEGREAKVTVSVDLKSLLMVQAPDAPADTTVRLYDGSDTLLGTMGEPIELKGGSLVVKAWRGSSLVAVGRWDGLTLYPNQLNLRSVPLNMPSLWNEVPNGGAGETLSFWGSGFGKWKKGQGPGIVEYQPERSVTISGQPAAIVYVAASQIEVRMPELSGAPALRPAVLSIGGLSLQGFAHLLGSLTIEGPSSPLSVGAERQFSVRARDTNQQEVSDPRVSWEVWAEDGMGGGFGEGMVGQISPTGLFQAERAGTGTIVVRSGSLLATASVTVE
jgi:hypothetical protein